MDVDDSAAAAGGGDATRAAAATGGADSTALMEILMDDDDLDAMAELAETPVAAQISHSQIIEKQAHSIAKLEKQVARAKEYKELTKVKLKEAALRLREYRLKVEALMGEVEQVKRAQQESEKKLKTLGKQRGDGGGGGQEPDREKEESAATGRGRGGRGRGRSRGSAASTSVVVAVEETVVAVETNSIGTQTEIQKALTPQDMATQTELAADERVVETGVQTQAGTDKKCVDSGSQTTIIGEIRAVSVAVSVGLQTGTPGVAEHGCQCDLPPEENSSSADRLSTHHSSQQRGEISAALGSTSSADMEEAKAMVSRKRKRSFESTGRGEQPKPSALQTTSAGSPSKSDVGAGATAHTTQARTDMETGSPVNCTIEDGESDRRERSAIQAAETKRKVSEEKTTLEPRQQTQPDESSESVVVETNAVIEQATAARDRTEASERRVESVHPSESSSLSRKPDGETTVDAPIRAARHIDAIGAEIDAELDWSDSEDEEMGSDQPGVVESKQQNSELANPLTARRSVALDAAVCDEIDKELDFASSDDEEGMTEAASPKPVMLLGDAASAAMDDELASSDEREVVRQASPSIAAARPSTFTVSTDPVSAAIDDELASSSDDDETERSEHRGSTTPVTGAAVAAAIDDELASVSENDEEDAFDLPDSTTRVHGATVAAAVDEEVATSSDGERDRKKRARHTASTFSIIQDPISAAIDDELASSSGEEDAADARSAAADVLMKSEKRVSSSDMVAESAGKVDGASTLSLSSSSSSDASDSSDSSSDSEDDLGMDYEAQEGESEVPIETETLSSSREKGSGSSEKHEKPLSTQAPVIASASKRDAATASVQSSVEMAVAESRPDGSRDPSPLKKRARSDSSPTADNAENKDVQRDTSSSTGETSAKRQKRQEDDSLPESTETVSNSEKTDADEASNDKATDKKVASTAPQPVQPKPGPKDLQTKHLVAFQHDIARKDKENEKTDDVFVSRTLTVLVRHCAKSGVSQPTLVTRFCSLLAADYRKKDISPMVMMKGTCQILRSPRVRHLITNHALGVCYLAHQVLVGLVGASNQVDDVQVVADKYLLAECLEYLRSLLLGDRNAASASTDVFSQMQSTPAHKNVVSHDKEFLAHVCLFYIRVCKSFGFDECASVLLFDLLRRNPNIKGLYFTCFIVEVAPELLRIDYDERGRAQEVLLRDTIHHVLAVVTTLSGRRQELLFEHSSLNILHQIAAYISADYLMEVNTGDPAFPGAFATTMWNDRILPLGKRKAAQDEKNLVFEVCKSLELLASAYECRQMMELFPVERFQDAFAASEHPEGSAALIKMVGAIAVVFAESICYKFWRARDSIANDGPGSTCADYVLRVCDWLQQLLTLGGSASESSKDVQAACAAVCVELIAECAATPERRDEMLRDVLKWFRAQPQEQQMRFPDRFLRQLRFVTVSTRPVMPTVRG